AKLPGYEEATEDLVMAAAEEMGRICEQVLHPLSAPGDREGCHYENGQVRTPAGFKEAYELVREGGWIGLAGRTEHGGQGMPPSIGVMISEMARASNLPFSMYMALSEGAIHALDSHATEELKQRFLPKLVSGEWSGT